MNIFETQADVEVQEERDSLGFEAKPTNLYEGKVKTAYVMKTDSGSFMQVVHLELTDANGKVFSHTERECVWSAKTGGDFYIDKKTKAKRQLIGKARMDSLCKLLTGKSLQDAAADMENKFHKVKVAGKDSNIEYPTFTTWADTPIYVALEKIVQNKQEKVGSAYKNTNEEEETNEVYKFFNASKQTLTEVTDGLPATYADKWVAKNADKTRNKFKAVVGGSAAAGIPDAAPAATLNLG